MTAVKSGVARQITNKVPITPSRQMTQERKDMGIISSTVNMACRQGRQTLQLADDMSNTLWWQAVWLKISETSIL